MTMATVEAPRQFRPATPAPALSMEERRRVQWAEDRTKLLRACRLLRMALGASRHPGGNLAELREPPPSWIVRALVVVAEDCIININRAGVDKALELLAEKRALAALMVLEEEVLRLRKDYGDPGEERPAPGARP